MRAAHDRFESEAELCSVFAEKVKAEGWEVYPEVKGWDMVAKLPAYMGVTESPGALRMGDQVAIEAKNKPSSIEALLQVADRRRADRWHAKSGGPQYTAILLPRASKEYVQLAAHHQTFVITPENFGTPLARLTRYRDPTRTGLWLPDFPHDTPAGLPSPSTLSKWRARAIGVCIDLGSRGYVTRDDFVRHGFPKGEASQWAQRGWLKNSGEKLDKLAKYEKGHNAWNLPIRGFESYAEKVKNSQSKPTERGQINPSADLKV